MMGRLHSIQSMGTLDGPGVRYVAFLQGCPLRCHCCHNPDTWDANGGYDLSSQALVQQAKRYRPYFGAEGGMTLSGGEPLMQPGFVKEVFHLCREAGISTCLDTSGYCLDDDCQAVLAQTDRVLLDIKYTQETLYQRHVGCSLDAPMRFLAYLDAQRIPTTLRQVIIPTVNDSAESIRALREIARAHACVDGVELLPFRKLCQTKYDMLGLAFPFGHLPEASKLQMAALQKYLEE